MMRRIFRTAAMPSRLGDHTSSRHNNFDLLRLIAAWLVLVSHSFALTGHAEPLHQFNATLGNVSVLVFFAISGLLIHRSWDFQPIARNYWQKRALRLLPALAVVSVLTTFVLGPLVTTRSMGSYFTSLETWIYPIRIVAQVPFGAQLPGVFDENHLSGAINGSLWSLPVEVTAYALLSLLGVVGILARRRMVALVATASLVAAYLWTLVVPHDLAQIGVISGFAVGAAAYSYRDRIVLDWRLVVLALVVAGISIYTPFRQPVWTVALAYVTFWIAYALPPIARWLTARGDVSYGMYIYAFPIQQLVIWKLGSDMSPWLVIAIATPVVWILGYLSWTIVEQPALRFKPARATFPDAPAPESAARQTSPAPAPAGSRP